MVGSEFLDKKLHRRFQTYDLDENGVIEKADFELAARRMGEAFGHAPDAPQQKALNSRLTRLWDALAKIADEDGDGRITEEEYKEAFHRLIIKDRKGFDRMYAPFVQDLVKAADTDGDGRISRAEHIRWYQALLNVQEKDSSEAFDRLDRDSDGYLTRDEIVQAVREYYFSDDPEKPGNWLLGPI